MKNRVGKKEGKERRRRRKNRRVTTFYLGAFFFSCSLEFFFFFLHVSFYPSVSSMGKQLENLRVFDSFPTTTHPPTSITNSLTYRFTCLWILAISFLLFFQIKKECSFRFRTNVKTITTISFIELTNTHQRIKSFDSFIEERNKRDHREKSKNVTADCQKIHRSTIETERKMRYICVLFRSLDDVW